jgi:tetratricopeptide (TPR) repeat protein
MAIRLSLAINLFIFTLSLTEAFSNPYLDSLKTVISSDSHDSIRYNALNEIAIAYSDSSYMSSVYYWKQALEISQKNRNRVQLAYLYGRIGQMLFEKGEFAQALESYKNALAVYEYMNDIKGKGMALNDIGLVYKSWGRYEQAIDNYLKALKIFQEIDWKDGVGISSNNIGQIYYYREEYEKSIHFFSLYLNISEKTNNPRAAAGASNNIAAAYMAMNSFDQALEYYNKALIVYDSLGIKLGVAILKDNIGSLLSQTTKYSEALTYHYRALEIFEELNVRPRMGYAFKNIGYAHYKLNNVSKALDYLLKSKHIAEEYNQQETLKEIYFILSDIYFSINNYKESLHYFKSFVDVKDSLLSVEAEESISKLELQFESDKRNQELALVQNKLEQQNIFGIVFGSIFLVFLFITSLAVWDNIRKRSLLKRLILDNKILMKTLNRAKLQRMDLKAENSKFNLATIPAEFKDENNVSFFLKEHNENTIIVTISFESALTDLSLFKCFCEAWLDEYLNKYPDVEAKLIVEELQSILHKFRDIYIIKRFSVLFNVLLINQSSNYIEFVGPNAAWVLNEGNYIKILSKKLIPFNFSENSNCIIYLYASANKSNQISANLEIEKHIEKSLETAFNTAFSNQIETLQSTIDYCNIYTNGDNSLILISLISK